ncbi:hypothetical protein CsSME_00005238 [Camellia sinensis var. sinensis]
MPATNAQKGGRKAIPEAPQHTRSGRHSHRPSREVGREEPRQEESRRTSHEGSRAQRTSVCSRTSTLL